MDSDTDRCHLVRSAAPAGAHIQCAPLYFPGPWDAVVVPAALYFSSPVLRKGPTSGNVFVYGPVHLFRSAWLAGARDYLRDPWTAEELFLRLRGPSPAHVECEIAGQTVSLEGGVLSVTAGAERSVGLHLSSGEAGLLRLLVQRRGLTVSRTVLAWGAGCSEGRVIDTLVGRLRKKLAALGLQDPIASVRGVGYRLP